MEFELKEKIQITDEFIQNLISKSWTDIENLELQIKNIEPSKKGKTIIHILTNLLNSYYVFTGELEGLNTIDISDDIPTDIIDIPKTEGTIATTRDSTYYTDKISSNNSEPFEYFVDFDEPTGTPITDADLYDN